MASGRTSRGLNMDCSRRKIGGQNEARSIGRRVENQVGLFRGEDGAAPFAGFDGGAHWAEGGEPFERRDELVRVHARAQMVGVVIVILNQ